MSENDASVDAPDTDAGGARSGETLEDAARGEREFMRAKLRAELEREPSEDELNEYVRQHTEGY